MNEAVLLLIVLNFFYIGLLAKFLFQGDFRFTVKWCATAFPMFLYPIFLVIAYVASLAPITPTEWTLPLELVAVTASAVSIALMFFTWGTHRRSISYFHQRNDTPQHLVTDGAYRRIRHPIYTSFILLYFAASVFISHWVTLFLFVYGSVALNLTAAGEEKRLSASEFGEEYRQYITRTGRFMPRLATEREHARD